MSEESGDPKNALRLDEETLRLIEQNGAGTSPPPYLVCNRARALENVGRYDESRSVYAACADAGTRAGYGASIAYGLVGQCSALREMGELSAAKGYCDQAAALIGKAASDKSPAALGLRIVRGRIALSERRLEDAQAAFTGAVGDPPRLNATALLGRSEVQLTSLCPGIASVILRLHTICIEPFYRA